jgi:Na+/proline symporter
MAAVMASDSQILALSTMFTEDVFTYYGGKERFGEDVQVRMGRLFVVLLTLVAYTLALRVPPSIFDIATQYAFAGFAALSPLMVAALFWKGSTKWGALAATIWTALGVVAVAVLQTVVPAPPPGAPVAILTMGGVDVVARASVGTLVIGLPPVVPLTIGSSLLMIVVSRLTASSCPKETTLARYFP